MAELRAPLVDAEPLAEGAPNLRAPLVTAAPVAEGVPNLRAAELVSEPLSEGYRNLRAALVVVETLEVVTEGGEMATEQFPIGLGLSWETEKTPVFNTQVRQATSLKSVRNSLTPFPAYDFEVSFVYLNNEAAADPNAATDLRTVSNFFKSMRGRQGAFLHRDPRDHQVRGGPQATGDAVTLQFPFAMDAGLPGEPVGQLDLTQLAAFAAADVTPATNRIALPDHAFVTGDGPVFAASAGTLPAGLVALTAYWLIVDTANAVRLAASKANALAGTAVDITDAGAGAHTLAKGWAVYLDGVLQGPADVAFVATNQMLFAAAPDADAAITADFDFFFVCHFEADAAAFRTFNRDLWELQQVRFRADPA
jgi:hypothetical protein